MNLTERKKVFIFDLDGTIYKGVKIIPGAKSILSDLKAQGKHLIFLTNNATQSRMSFAHKLKNMGIECTEDQIITSGYIASIMLSKSYKINFIYVIGSSELIKMIEDVGIKTLNHTLPENTLYAPFLDSTIRCDAVLTSLDREFNYMKIRAAMELINRGAEFYATNGDTTFPEQGQLWPGGGVMLAAVQACVGREPKEVFGKPNPHGLRMIYENLKEKGIDLQDMVLVGDRFETDILQANRMGIESVLVETGINTLMDLEKISDLTLRSELTPTYIIPSIRHLLD